MPDAIDRISLVSSSLIRDAERVTDSMKKIVDDLHKVLVPEEEQDKNE